MINKDVKTNWKLLQMSKNIFKFDKIVACLSNNKSYFNYVVNSNHVAGQQGESESILRDKCMDH